MVEITMLSAADTELVAAITELVNEVYAIAEKGLWTEGTKRTDADEVAELVRTGQLAVARQDGELVGCVRIQRLDEVTGGFGMLAVAPQYQAIGAGRRLVEFAEEQIAADGRRVMQLELLVPTSWTQPTKQWLGDWYSRLGYRLVRSEPLVETYPHLAPLLATDCRSLVYHKQL